MYPVQSEFVVCGDVLAIRQSGWTVSLIVSVGSSLLSPKLVRSQDLSH